MQVVDGDAQHGTAGEELPDPLVVQVTDDRGRPVRGQLVNWRVTAGGGTVFAGSAITDREGMAQERWSLGTVAGAPQQVEARAVDTQTGEPLVFATFTAVAEAGQAARLVSTVEGTLGAPAGAPVPTPIAVRATDTHGNPVEGVTVTWTASHGGSASPATSTTDADGEASTTWTLGGASGAQTLVASSGSLEPATISALAGAGAAARLEILAGNAREAEVGTTLADDLAVRALDAFDNPVPGVAVSWAVTSGGGSVAPLAATTDEAGIATAKWTLGTTAGTQTAAASAEGVEDAAFTATALAGDPAVIAIVSGDDQDAVVGQELAEPLVVRVTDEHANPTPGVGVAWAVTSGGGSVIAIDGSTDDDGRASARWTVGSIGDGNRATATAAGHAVTFRATGNPAGGARLTAETTPPASLVVRSTTSVTVRLVDGSGAPIPGATVTWTGGGSGTPGTSTTDASGESTIGWRLGPTAGEQTLVASVPNVEPVSFSTLATPAEGCDGSVESWPYDPLPVLRIGETKSGLRAHAFDWYGNPISGWSPYGVSPVSPDAPLESRPQLVGSLQTDATGYSGTASIRAGTQAGEQRLYMLGAMCYNVSSDPDLFTRRNLNIGIPIYVLPDPPARVQAMDFSQRQTGTVGQPLPQNLGLFVWDQYSNVVPNEQITWTVTSRGGSITPSSTTDAEGRAFATWTLGPVVGTQTVTATTSNGVSVTFSAYATAP